MRETAQIHYRRIKEAVKQERIGDGAIEAFESWIFARFNDRQEVDAMFTDIVPFEESFAGRYLKEKYCRELTEKVRKQSRLEGLRDQLDLLARLHESEKLSDHEYNTMAEPLRVELAGLESSENREDTDE